MSRLQRLVGNWRRKLSYGLRARAPKSLAENVSGRISHVIAVPVLNMPAFTNVFEYCSNLTGCTNGDRFGAVELCVVPIHLCEPHHLLRVERGTTAATHSISPTIDREDPAQVAMMATKHKVQNS
jgi:hypothetical protein